MFYLLLAQAATNKTVTDVVEKVVESEVVQSGTVKQVLKDISIWDHIWQSDPLVKATLLLLIFFSVGCWAIIFLKISQLKAAQKSSQSFWHKFSSAAQIADVAGSKSSQGPLYEIFATGQQAMEKIKKSTSQLKPYHRDMLSQRINQSKEEEIYKLEQYVSFLATTASAAPFIGLFGTVWGILTAFMAIGKAGSSSLATVGPYIAEALVATAVGLFAAIPAVIAYNYFVNKIKIINKMIDLFIDDFMLKSEKEFA